VSGDYPAFILAHFLGHSIYFSEAEKFLILSTAPDLESALPGFSVNLF